MHQESGGGGADVDVVDKVDWDAQRERVSRRKDSRSSSLWGWRPASISNKPVKGPSSYSFLTFRRKDAVEHQQRPPSLGEVDGPDDGLLDGSRNTSSDEPGAENDGSATFSEPRSRLNALADSGNQTVRAGGRQKKKKKKSPKGNTDSSNNDASDAQTDATSPKEEPRGHKEFISKPVTPPRIPSPRHQQLQQDATPAQGSPTNREEAMRQAKAWRIQRGRSYRLEKTRDSMSVSGRGKTAEQKTDEKLGEALIDASMFGKVEDLKRLLELGADTSFVDSNGYTALHWAACNGQDQCLAILIYKGADVNAVDYLGWTSLHYAVFSGQQGKNKSHLKVVELLLAAGADKERKNNKGKKAIDLTTNKAMIALLKRKRTPSVNTAGSGSATSNGKYTLFKRKKGDSKRGLPSKGVQEKVSNPKMVTKKIDEEEILFKLQLAAIERWEQALKVREREVWSREEEMYNAEKGLKMEVLRLKRVVEEDRIREASFRSRVEEVEKFEKLKKEKEQSLQEHQRKKLVTSVDFNELELGDCLGGGASAKVYRAIWREDIVAVKKIAFNDPQINAKAAMDDFHRETLLLGRMRHMNIVLLMGACVDHPNLCLIMEQMTRGDLYSLLHRQKNSIIPWDLRLQIMLDIARGMNYLHQMKPPMIHRDLKSKNILLDDTFRAKISDFGTTRVKEETFIHTRSNDGTPSWMAPECLRGEDFDEKSDIYSFGVVLYEVLERKVPWEGREAVQIIGAVGFGGDRPPLPAKVPAGCPEGILNLISCCWAANPGDRPGFPHILPYLRTWVEESLRQV